MRVTDKQYTHDTAFHGVKIFGSKEKLNIIYNKVFRNELVLSTNTAGVANPPNDDGEYWLGFMCWHKDVETVKELLV